MRWLVAVRQLNLGAGGTPTWMTFPSSGSKGKPPNSVMMSGPVFFAVMAGGDAFSNEATS